MGRETWERAQTVPLLLGKKHGYPLKRSVGILSLEQELQGGVLVPKKPVLMQIKGNEIEVVLEQIQQMDLNMSLGHEPEKAFVTRGASTSFFLLKGL